MMPPGHRDAPPVLRAQGVLQLGGRYRSSESRGLHFPEDSAAVAETTTSFSSARSAHLKPFGTRSSKAN